MIKSLPERAQSQTRILASLRSTLRKQESRDNKLQSRKEPGRETTEKPTARMAGIFC